MERKEPRFALPSQLLNNSHSLPEGSNSQRSQPMDRENIQPPPVFSFGSQHLRNLPSSQNSLEGTHREPQRPRFFMVPPQDNPENSNSSHTNHTEHATMKIHRTMDEERRPGQGTTVHKDLEIVVEETITEKDSNQASAALKRRDNLQEPRQEHPQIEKNTQRVKPVVPSSTNQQGRAGQANNQRRPEKNDKPKPHTGTMEEERPRNKNESKRPGRTNPRNVSNSESKASKLSKLKSDDSFMRFPLGDNIPNSQFRDLLKTIIREQYPTQQKNLFEKEAIIFLKIATESFLVEKFRLASHVTRARGRKTISPTDLETVDLIENDIFLRRKSLPPLRMSLENSL